MNYWMKADFQLLSGEHFLCMNTEVDIFPSVTLICLGKFPQEKKTHLLQNWLEICSKWSVRCALPFRYFFPEQNMHASEKCFLSESELCLVEKKLLFVDLALTLALPAALGPPSKASRSLAQAETVPKLRKVGHVRNRWPAMHWQPHCSGGHRMSRTPENLEILELLNLVLVCGKVVVLSFVGVFSLEGIWGNFISGLSDWWGRLELCFFLFVCFHVFWLGLSKHL